jgi:hypothetical protein
MFIVDEIHRDDGNELGRDLPGGAGSIDPRQLRSDHKESMPSSAHASLIPRHYRSECP